MASGRQLAELNWTTFNTWMSGKSDIEFRQMVGRGVLSRKEIAKECGFSKSVLDQNPRIRVALHELEAALRARGVMPPADAASSERSEIAASAPLREVGGQRAMLDMERLKRLEQENASLHAENTELKRQLERYAVLHEALSLTGRVPR